MGVRRLGMHVLALAERGDRILRSRGKTAESEVMTIAFRVSGVPVAQGRPRAFVPRGWTARAAAEGREVKPRAYDPKRSRAWKKLVSSVALVHRPERVIEGPVMLYLSFFLPRPQQPGDRAVFHATQPDLGNLVKAVEDALTGIVYGDDSQVVRCEAMKAYALTLDPPGVCIEVEELDAAEAHADERPVCTREVAGSRPAGGSEERP